MLRIKSKKVSYEIVFVFSCFKMSHKINDDLKINIPVVILEELLQENPPLFDSLPYSLQDIFAKISHTLRLALPI